MKKATTIRKLITLSLCLMMCLSVFAPASVFAKCSHKNTKLVVLKEVTCTRNGKCVKVCIKCGKNLKTCSVKKLGHTYKHIYIKPTCNNRGWEGTMCKRCGCSKTDAHCRSSFDSIDNRCGCYSVFYHQVKAGIFKKITEGSI